MKEKEVVVEKEFWNGTVTAVTAVTVVRTVPLILWLFWYNTEYILRYIYSEEFIIHSVILY